VKSARPQPHNTRAAEIADTMREDIITHALAPGCALRELALAKRYNTSRIPLREAFRRLAAEGLLTIRPYRGAVVNEVSVEHIREIMELRGALSQLAIRRALPLRDNEDLGRLEALLDAAEQTDDPIRWASLTSEFHLTLLDAPDRPRLMGLLRSLHDQTRRYRRYAFARPEARALSERSLRELLAVCRTRDAAAAAAQVRLYHENLLNGVERMGNVLTRAEEPVQL
jgi:DNA-binding GntR family transcriptional regulator